MSAEQNSCSAMPWESSKYDFVEELGYDSPDRAAEQLLQTIEKASAKHPHAETIRDDLLARFHRPPADLDVDHALHFVKALGIKPNTLIICSTDIPTDTFHEAVRAHGLPWYDAGAQNLDTIGSVLLHPSDIHKFPLEQALVHELAHSGKIFPGMMFNEGFACLTDSLYMALRDPNAALMLTPKPPYSPHGAGMFAALALCRQDPTYYDTMAAYTGSGTVQSFSRYLEQSYELYGGARAYIHAMLTYNPGEWSNTLTPPLDRIVTQDIYDDPKACIASLLPALEKRLRAYEAKTGYSFNFPAWPSQIGSVALREAAVLHEPTDRITALIQQVTSTMQ